MATLLLAAVTGCGPDSTETTPDVRTGSGAPVGQGSAERLEAAFDVEVRPSETAVDISYRWANESDQPVLLVNRPVDYTGTATGPPNPTAWYAVGVGDGLVQISQRIFETPPDAPDYATDFTTGVTLVPPGDAVDGRLSVPLPLEEAKPFPDEYAEGETPVQDPRRVQFCLGALVPPYEPGLTQPGDDGLEGFHGATDLQRLFCSDPVPLA